MSYPFNQIPSTNPQNIGVPTPVGLQTAARNPTPSDNTYVPGSEWQNSVSKAFYKCVSSTVAGAVWSMFIPSSGGGLTTLTGNSGGAVGPDGMANINVVGDGITILIAGNPGTNTLTASLVGGKVAAQSYPVDINNPAGNVVPTAAGVLNLTGSTSTYTNGAVLNTVHTEVQGANHAVFIGKGALTPASTIPVGNNGEVLIGSGPGPAGDPAFALLTSPDSSITFVTGPNSLSLAVTGGTSVGKTITGDSGGARPPTAGNWTIIGGTVVAGTSPLKTAGAGSTITINAQLSQALAAGDSTKVGLANFDSSSFAVSATGFVTLTSGLVGASKFTVTSATGGAANPVVPDGAGNVTITATSVAANTLANGMRTHTSAANAYIIETQLTSTSAATNTTRQGLASFDSAFFTADANGWVTSGPTGSTSTWTPALTIGGSSAGITYVRQVGYYQRIGNLVYFTWNIALSSKGASAGIAVITGLPAALGPTGAVSMQTFPMFFNGVTFSVSYYLLLGIGLQSGTSIQLTQYGSGVVNTALLGSNLSNVSTMGGSGFYFTN